MEKTHLQQINSWIYETLSLFGEHALRKNINIETNKRFVRRLGDAQWLPNKQVGIIRFSENMWPFLSEHERKVTVVHEICHIVDSKRGGSREFGGHGESWQELMIACGLEPNRYAAVRVPAELKRKIKKHEAKCVCRTFMISSIRRTKMLSGDRYRCKDCMQLLQLTEQVKQVIT